MIVNVIMVIIAGFATSLNIRSGDAAGAAMTGCCLGLYLAWALDSWTDRP